MRIGELDPAEQAASDLLVAHEVALRDFARAELAGDSDTSLDDDQRAGAHALISSPVLERRVAAGWHR